MIGLKLCQNCKWSAPERGAAWSNRCFNPVVNVRDPHALSWNASDGDRRGTGTSCIEERKKRWPIGACGMRGALYEAKEEP
jgi:hypothetical protein